MAQEYFGLVDLAERWNYTRQGVYKLAQLADFPAPDFMVNGHVRVWRVVSIAGFEADHPEVRSDWAKRRKIYGFAKAVSKG